MSRARLLLWSMVACSFLGASCESGRLIAPATPEWDVTGVPEWVSRAVGEARAEAAEASNDAGVRLAQTRRDLFQSYLDAMDTLMTAFRDEVPYTDPERAYETASIEVALTQARSASDALATSGTPRLAGWDEMESGAARFLVAVDGAVQALREGEPASDQTAFIARNSEMVESFFDWVLAAESIAAQLDALGFDGYL